jgi:putative transposase
MEYRRLHQPGSRYFFTVVTEGRRPLLVDHIERLREAFRLSVSRYPFEIEAIVILPDHVHTLWKLPDGDVDFSTRWMVIKRKFSAGLPAGPVNVSKSSKREKGVWQRRFWEHCIRDEGDWRRRLDYIHYNPVKHGYVSASRDWPYGSFRPAVANGWYSLDWAAPTQQ